MKILKLFFRKSSISILAIQTHKELTHLVIVEKKNRFPLIQII